MPPSRSSIETLRGFGVFTRVITQGKRYEKKPIKAFVTLSSSSYSALRVGYAVTKGIRKAVQRNRIKRLMREAFRANKESFIHQAAAPPLCEIVFMYTGPAEFAAARTMSSSINKAIAEISSMIGSKRMAP
jgi:ribonuclease P protein component